MVDKKVFESWLNENEILHEWNRAVNFRDNFKRKYASESRVDRDVIYNTLTWDSTPQGHEFWEGWHRKWKSHYSTIN